MGLRRARTAPQRAGLSALRGANQLLNASAALAALESVRELLPVPQQAVRMGLLQASLPGRFQILPGQPAVILDVAHNPHAAAVLAQNLDNMGFHPYTHAVFGMLNDKDLAGVVAKLGSRVDHWYCAGLPARAAPAAKTWRGRSARPCRPRQRAVKIPACRPMPIRRGLSAARERAAENDRIVVFGRFSPWPRFCRPWVARHRQERGQSGLDSVHRQGGGKPPRRPPKGAARNSLPWVFKRKDPADQAQSSKRAAVPSEVQAAELRGRARRRLAGAIALVLAAVIVLPMVLDSQPVPVADNIPIKVPERNTPFQPQVSEPQVAPPVASAQGAGQTSGAAAPADPTGTIPTPPPVVSVPPPVMTAQPQVPPAGTTPTTSAAAQPSRPDPKPAAKPDPKPDPKPAACRKRVPTTAPARWRCSRAAARLPPRRPPQSRPRPRAISLQVAAYTTSDDAQSRRSKLHQAGVTNAFVEQANIGGKQQYRLRVGPFLARGGAGGPGAVAHAGL